MELATAIQLIEQGVPVSDHPQQWADLGAGKGLFTNALASRLPTGSLIHAIDRDLMYLKQVPEAFHDVRIVKIQQDFVHQNLKLGPLNGVLMANSLHFVQNKILFLTQLKKWLKPDATVIIIEYEIDTPNQWVPFPLRFQSLVSLASSLGFSTPDRIGEAPSIYNGVKIYSAKFEVL